MAVQTAESLTLKVRDRKSMDSALDAAVEKLAGMAKFSRCGILVTRIGADVFSVSIDRGVPFGTTLELSNW